MRRALPRPLSSGPVVDDPYDSYLRSWARHLTARNKAPLTVKSYLLAGRLLADWLRVGPPDDHPAGEPWPSSYPEVSHQVLERFFAYMLDSGRASSTVAARYAGLQQLYLWLLEIEEEIDRSPFERLRPPHVPETEVDVVTIEQMKALLATCRGRRSTPAARKFRDVRDEAILRALYDTGGRNAELTLGLEVDDVDLDLQVFHLHGKGRRERSVPFGANTANAVDRYVRARSKHAKAHLRAFWLSQRGALTDGGLRQMMRRRCAAAGIPPVHPHQLRHTAADAWFEAGGSTLDAKRLFGWKSDTMVEKYTRARADVRAHEAKRRLAPGDNI